MPANAPRVVDRVRRAAGVWHLLRPGPQLGAFGMWRVVSDGRARVRRDLAGAVSRGRRRPVPVGEWAFDVVVEAPPATASTPRLPCSWSSANFRRPRAFRERGGRSERGAPGGGAVPAVNDYANYADMTGFRSHGKYHYKLFSAANLGEYYVAVFNNDVYLQEGDIHYLGAEPSPSPNGPIGCARELQLSKG